MNNPYIESQAVQGTPEWHKARCGCLTASRVHIVMDGSAKAKNSLMDELEANVITGVVVEKKFFSLAMEWGKRNEERARATYNLNFPGMDSCGFFHHGTYLHIGGSPDGVLRDRDTGFIIGGLEIKCPYNPAIHESHRMGTIAPAYFWQIQFAMWLLNTPFWDFMSFDPRRNGPEQYHFRRFIRDESIMNRITDEIFDWHQHRLMGTRYQETVKPIELMAAGILPKFF